MQISQVCKHQFHHPGWPEDELCPECYFIPNVSGETRELVFDAIYALKDISRPSAHTNNVFNRTPRARSFLWRCLARAGNWLIKLSERAG
jgi:hypothetical protein